MSRIATAGILDGKNCEAEDITAVLTGELPCTR